MEFGIWVPVYGGWLRLAEAQPTPSFAFCRRVAVRAEQSGYDYLYGSQNLLNCVYGVESEVADPWIYLSGIAACTQRVKLVVGAKPGFAAPAVVAQAASSLDNISTGRLALNIVCGWWRREFEQASVPYLDHDGRYDRADEYLQCLHGLWKQEHFSFSGQHFQLQNAIVAAKPWNKRTPEIWISGHSDSACRLAVNYGDVMFLNGMPDDELAERINSLRGNAHCVQRKLRFAMSAFVIMAETDAAARARRQQLIAGRNQALIDHLRSTMTESGASMWEGLSDEQMVDSNCGFDAGLIGSPRTIASRIARLRKLGVDILVLQFEDMENDAERFAGEVMAPFKAGSTGTARAAVS